MESVEGGYVVGGEWELFVFAVEGWGEVESGGVN